MVTNRIDGIFAAMNNVQDTGWNASFYRQFDQAHGHHRVLLRRLEHKSIAGGNGHREHPQRNHGRKVERRNARTDTQRLQKGVGVHATGHIVGQFAQLQVADAGSVLDHF